MVFQVIFLGVLLGHELMFLLGQGLKVLGLSGFLDQGFLAIGLSPPRVTALLAP
jgi:hypothetical protein